MVDDILTGLAKNASIINLTDKEFSDLAAFVYTNYGIDLSKKRQLVEGRLTSTLKQHNFTSFSQYMDLLRTDRSGTEITNFLNKITTNYSYFARENEHFEFLMKTALPDLVKTRKDDLRIWSAGCSAGQEPYNIAMAIDQYFGFRKGSWDTTILATDISSSVLQQAKTATYPIDSIKDIPPTWRKLYFDMLPNNTVQVKQKIRDEVVFKSFNLMNPFEYKKKYDIIFCRNVMIYFDAETTKKLVKKFYDATADGGYLFIGHSESIDKTSSGYEYIRPAVYKKIIKKV